MNYFTQHINEEEWSDKFGLVKSRTVLGTVEFQNVNLFDQFATIAHNQLIIWRKIANGEKFLAGQTDDGYTCPQPNAVSLGGFPAVFKYNDPVFKVDSSEHNS